MTLAARIKGNLGSGDTNRNPSPGIWGDCPVISILEGTIAGQYLFDDFTDLPLAPTLTTQIAFGRYKAFADTSCTMTSVSTINSVELGGGYLQYGFNAQDDGVSIAHAYPSFLLKSTSGKLWFEARVATSDVTTANGVGFLLGLAETEQWTLAATVPLAADDTPDNSASLIGFHYPEDDLTTIDTVYNDRAATFTQVKDAAVTGLAAYTFVKLGMVFDPDAPAANRVTFYKNGVALADKVSHSTLTGLTNLDANAVGPVFASIVDSGGTSHNLWMDWWRVAQLD